MTGLIIIYLTIDLFEKLRKFIGYNAEFSHIILYFSLKLPKIIFHITPVSILLSTLITLILLSRNNEIIAMKACGISIARLSLPILSLSLFISISLLIANLSFIPTANKRLRFVKEVVIEKREEEGYLKQNRIWFRSKDHTIYNIQLLDLAKEKMYGINIYMLGKDFSLSETIEAKELLYRDGKFVLLSGIRRRFFSDGIVDIKHFEEEVIALDKKISEFKQLKIDEEEITYPELKRYVKSLIRDGYKSDRYMVDLYGKISFPFVCVIISLIGIPFGLKEVRGKGIAIGIGTGIIIGFTYWIVYSLSISLGHSSLIPPLLSAWLANILFMITGSYLFLDVSQR